MNMGFFGGIPELARAFKSRLYQSDNNANTAAQAQNVYQTLEVDAPDYANCGLQIVVKGAGPLIATGSNEAVANQTNNPALVGNARGTESVDWQRVRSAASAVSSGTRAVIGGGSNNTAAGTNSTVAGGSSNQASATASTISGGDQNTNNANYGFIPGGRFGSNANRDSSWAWGTQGSVTAARQQCAGQGQVATTTNATATATTDNSTPGTLSSRNIFTLQNSSAVLMNCRVLARDTAAANDIRAWDVEVVARRGANAAATTVDFTNVVSVFNTGGAAAWTIAVVTDTTIGGFYFNVTGEAGKTIRWMVKIDGVEVA